MSPEEKIILGVDKALGSKRDRLSDWEIGFLNGLRDQFRKKSQLSPKQKNIAWSILKKLGVIE